jgi:hypothetical protein
MSSVTSVIRLINPLGFPEESRSALAPRLKSLEGKTIGIIDNIKPNAGLFLSFLKEMLLRDNPTLRFLKVRKDFTSSRLIADELKGKVQGAINAWGD